MRIIKNVPVGRYSVKASFVGYESVVMHEQLLSSSKELILEIALKEISTTLSEVVIRPQVNKQHPLNEMVQVGARMFSVEETNRYAGGMSDPARTASMFASVAAGGATNGISIHGNSPQMLQWRIEGIEVNNPNHYAEISQAGGGIFTALSDMILANSDFLTGAMPAKFGNAISGVFDMKMRVGNNTKYEHNLQFGTLGVDFASEGPIGKNNASYLINYRYSFIEIAKKLHAINMDKETLDYQDLNFKINIPTKKAGTIAIWFTGLYDNYKNEAPDVSDWETLWDMNDSHSRQSSFAGGITDTYLFKSGGRLRLNIALTGNYVKLDQNDYLIVDESQPTSIVCMPDLDGYNNNWNIVVDAQYKHKFSAKYTMQHGINYTLYNFDSWMDRVQQVGGDMRRIYQSNGSTGLMRLYTNHKLALTNRLSIIAGVNMMYFALNDQLLVEPRVSVACKTSSTSTLALAYALNSRKESTDTYFVQLINPDNPNVLQSNKSLGFTRSHYISMTFSQYLGENAILKIEPYWQYLFDVPVEIGTTYSIINNDLFFPDRILTNDGTGRNYGIDLTLEHYLYKGYYGMLTATLFKSEYQDAQGEWHNSSHDYRWIANVMGGKEWMTGKNHKNLFGINGRVTFMGGKRYTPIQDGVTFEDIMLDPNKSIPQDTDNPYSKQQKTNVGFAVSVKYTVNRPYATHHFILEYLSLSSFQGQTFDLRTHEIVDKYTSLAFPNIAYRIEF